MGKYTYLKIGIFVFSYTLIVSLFVDLILLPNFFPDLYFGNGLLKNYDAVRFHLKALKIFSENDLSNWIAQNFEFGNESISIIIHVCFYQLFVPEPFVLIPLSSFFVALSTVILSAIIYKFTPNKKVVLFSTLPFFMFPSSLQWCAQWNKDPMFIFGFFLILYSFLSFLESDNFFDGKTVLYFIFLIAGSLFTLIFRPYIIFLIGPGFLMAIVFLLIRGNAFSFQGDSAILKIIVMAFVFFAIHLTFHNSFFFQHRASYQGAEKKLEENYAKNKSPLSGVHQEHKYNYMPTPYLPDLLDKAIYKLHHYRVNFLVNYPLANTNIDTTHKITTAGEFLLYLPKAMTIAYLAPFPRMLLAQDSNIMRKIVTVEMGFVYLGLIGFLYGVFHRKNIQKLYCFIIAVNSVCMLTYAVMIPNMGTLYRLRYGYLMVIVCIGYGEIIQFLRLKKNGS